jgi:hypothetical protein
LLFTKNLKTVNKKIKDPAPDISYFRLSLTDFLKESHPERLKDKRFIISCADAATEAYEQAIRNGDTPDEAAHRASAVLFKDLHFFFHDTLVNILWNEFTNAVPEETAYDFAEKLLPECETVFAQYPLSDGFAYEPEYELLYTELTGVIALYLETKL